jgi:putative hydrolase of the HAD superfamily
MRAVESPRREVKAVLWDFGGVITTSPFDAFAAYERDHGLPAGFIRAINATNPDGNAWASLERGHLDMEAFVARFEEEARAAGGELDALALMSGLGETELRPAMVEAVRRCHQRLKTGLLTNNFVLTNGRHRAAAREAVLSDFDVVVESSLTGSRKPDPHFYRLACDLLGIEPVDAVFLDDLGVNLKPARAMGMQTIKVTDPDAALAELEAIVGFPVRA